MRTVGHRFYSSLAIVIALLNVTACQKASMDSTPEPNSITPQPQQISASILPPPPKGSLFAAVRLLQVDEVRQLLNRGADPNENLGTEEEPLTPLWLATALGVEDPHENRIRSIMSILRYRGASPFIPFEGYTALDLAIDSGNDGLVDALAFKDRFNSEGEDEGTL